MGIVQLSYDFCICSLNNILHRKMLQLNKRTRLFAVMQDYSGKALQLGIIGLAPL
jgi:hypothetical protein